MDSLHKGPVTNNFDILFDVDLHKLLNKQTRVTRNLRRCDVKNIIFSWIPTVILPVLRGTAWNVVCDLLKSASHMITSLRKVD